VSRAWIDGLNRRQRGSPQCGSGSGHRRKNGGRRGIPFLTNFQKRSIRLQQFDSPLFHVGDTAGSMLIASVVEHQRDGAMPSAHSSSGAERALASEGAIARRILMNKSTQCRLGLDRNRVGSTSPTGHHGKMPRALGSDECVAARPTFYVMCSGSVVRMNLVGFVSLSAQPIARQSGSRSPVWWERFIQRNSERDQTLAPAAVLRDRFALAMVDLEHQVLVRHGLLTTILDRKHTYEQE
jgi:hypothetical protein